MAIGTPVTNFGEFTAAGTSAVPYPGTVRAGDCLLLYGSVANAGLVTLPAGYTSIFTHSATSNGAAPDIFAAYKTGGATGSESGTLTVTHNNNVNIFGMAAVPGVDLLDPIDSLSTLYDGGSGSGITYAAQTLLNPGSMLWYVSAMASTLSTWSPGSGPGTFTEVMDLNTGTRSCAVGYLGGLQAGPQTAVTTASSGSSLRVGRCFALKPATRGRFLGFM